MTDRSPEFDEGHAAYTAGYSMDLNPHIDLSKRDRWNAGYLHAESESVPKTERIDELVIVGGEG